MQRYEWQASGGWQTKQSLTLLPDLAWTTGGWQTKQSLTLLPVLVTAGLISLVYNISAKIERWCA